MCLRFKNHFYSIAFNMITNMNQLPINILRKQNKFLHKLIYENFLLSFKSIFSKPMFKLFSIYKNM